MNRYQVVVYIHYKGNNKRLSFDKDIVSVGSHQDNDIVLDQEGVEEIHLSLYREVSSIFIRDDSSEAGVYVDNQTIAPGQKLELSENSAIRLGKSSVFLKSKSKKVGVTATKSKVVEDLPPPYGSVDIDQDLSKDAQASLDNDTQFVDPKILYLEKVKREIKDKKDELEFYCVQIPDLKSRHDDLSSQCEELDRKIKNKISELDERSHKLGREIRKKEEELKKTQTLIEHKLKNFESDIHNKKIMFDNEIQQQQLAFSHAIQKKEQQSLEKVKSLEQRGPKCISRTAKSWSTACGRCYNTSLRYRKARSSKSRRGYLGSRKTGSQNQI